MLCNEEICAAVQEERFTRKKHDSSFPFNSIIYCLNSNNINLNDIDYVVYYEKPLITFERLLETYIATAPRGIRSFIAAMQTWVKEKIFIKSEIKNQLKKIQDIICPNSETKYPKLLFSEHHLSHAAAAFFPSPFEESVILCMDGVGEWATTSAWIGNGNSIKPLWEINFPHSLGLLYSAFTSYCGFKVNSGEYKLMGLAPYGEPIYVDKIKNNLIEIKTDGTFKLDLSFFKFHRGFRMTSRKFHKLFGKSPREKGIEISKFYMDLAASIQVVIEEIIIKLAITLKEETGINNLCLSGGVALNCVANGKLLERKIFEKVWIQPASGDAGSSLGAAYTVLYEYLGKNRKTKRGDSMKGSFLGCKFSNEKIIKYLKEIKAPFESFEDEELFKLIARYLNEGKVIGWFNGPMEFGPRALGGRSIIGDPRNKKMQSLMNLKIKNRESFRPFAPSILEEDVYDQFEIKVKSPYMLFVAPVKKELWEKISFEEENLFGVEKLKIVRSSIPAVTHVDYSARVQTVGKKYNLRFYNLIKSFKKLTDCPSVINTSFNVRGEPIVCTPKDAYRCFMRTEMDILVLENQILFKQSQDKNHKFENWDQNFELD